MSKRRRQADSDRLDRIVAEARRGREAREQAYRERALKLFPWVCGRCGREFSRENLSLLTVHHRDHDHDNNPPDGSNWELLCRYCHDNEHARRVDANGRADPAGERDMSSSGTHRPFEDLDRLLKRRD